MCDEAPAEAGRKSRAPSPLDGRTRAAREAKQDSRFSMRRRGPNGKFETVLTRKGEAMLSAIRKALLRGKDDANIRALVERWLDKAQKP